MQRRLLPTQPRLCKHSAFRAGDGSTRGSGRHGICHSMSAHDVNHKCQPAIKQTTLMDVPHLAAIEELCKHEASNWSAQQIEEELQRPIARVLTAHRGGAPIGFVAGWLVAGELQVLELAVHPQHQGRGTGTALMVELLCSSGCCSSAIATLEVREDNARAQGFYWRLGFQQVGRRERYYLDGAAAVLLTRRPGPLPVPQG